MFREVPKKKIRNLAPPFWTFEYKNKLYTQEFTFLRNISPGHTTILNIGSDKSDGDNSTALAIKAGNCRKVVKN